MTEVYKTIFDAKSFKTAGIQDPESYLTEAYISGDKLQVVADLLTSSGVRTVTGCVVRDSHLSIFAKRKGIKLRIPNRIHNKASVHQHTVAHTSDKVYTQIEAIVNSKLNDKNKFKFIKQLIAND